ncbi:polyribonucleotide 5'-hydroxyl-kinase clp1 [Anaeramoeba ignava]|uniref:Polyribonucleotide 5'-hydroxyl-kinase clp1 n=1 Tax=Anaeramoeba ignava TaxID=1746090 RepID=A0A9Q0LKC3_ANAIG|nr:polyribonucleotide 5'-hydroxyl-kinase clp1 [Anaeramoeba ignava]
MIQEIQLSREQELRIQVEFGQQLMITLKTGTAEIFGAEMASHRTYSFTGISFPIFTWYGCTLQIQGEAKHYISNNSLMISYLNIHSILQHKREISRENINIRGPRVLIAGPIDSGKSSLCKILINYATRFGENPCFVDLDIGQGEITIPGTLSTTIVHEPIDIEEGFSLSNPLVYFYGNLTPTENTTLFSNLLNKITQSVNEKLQISQKSRSSGLIINTMGWVDGFGYSILFKTITLFEVDYVLVLEIVLLEKPIGIKNRDSNFRRTTRFFRIQKYFYGALNNFSPFVISFDFQAFIFLKIFRVNPQQNQNQTSEIYSQDPRFQIMEITPDQSLEYSICAVSFGKFEENQNYDKNLVREENVAGFLFVSKVEPETQTIWFLSPTQTQFPGNILLFDDLQWK